uniref:Uncharacterized protein n=1 Tax=Anopheles maculatus TaxID=74869 RepID=A0A182SZV7_9DIPT
MSHMSRAESVNSEIPNAKTPSWKQNAMDPGMMAGKTASETGPMLGSIGHPHNPLRPHPSPTPATLQQQTNSHQHLHHHHHQQQHHPHHPTDTLTEVSVVDINASLAASAPLISQPHVASVHPIGAGVSAGHVPGFCNILNASNSSDLQAVAYNSLTQNVRCKSPPTLVDNLKNGTIGQDDQRKRTGKARERLNRHQDQTPCDGVRYGHEASISLTGINSAAVTAGGHTG